MAVRAGAGSGKTTIVGQWLDVDDRPAAWVTLDRSDDDPVVLLRDVIEALDGVEPMPEVAERLDGRPPDVLTDALSALGVSIRSERRPFLLVLDDVHVLTGAVSVDLLEQLLDMVPNGSQVVLVGRSIPPIHLTRRLLGGRASILEPGDVAVTESESRELLERSLPALDDPTRAALLEMTEGWVAGLSLAILALKEHPDPGGSIASLLAGDRRTAEYFHEEVLRQLPEPARRFLTRTSVLDCLNAALCDALLDQSESATMLRRLAETGIVVRTSIEGAAGWYRPQPLFAEFLRAELRSTAPEEEADLHRRAATWLAADDQAAAAVHHALATDDLAFAADVIYGQLFPAFERGQLASMDRWLAAFAPEEVRQRPQLALAAGWLAVARGNLADTESWIGVSESLADEDQLRGQRPNGGVSTEVARAALVMFAALGGVKQAAESARTVLEAGPDRSPWWATARLIEALALHESGAVEDRVATMSSVEFDLRGAGPEHAVAVAHLALAHLDRGDEVGHRLAEEAVAELEALGLGDYAFAGMVHCARAYATAQRGAVRESRAADLHAAALADSMKGAVPRGLIHQRLVLADAACIRGDRARAADHLAEAGVLLPHEPDATVLQTWADRLRERVEQASARSSRAHGAAITAAERRVLEQLPTHYSLAEIGDQLFVSRNTVKSHTIAIYRKLGVSSRADAVAKARDLGLLES